MKECVENRLFEIRKDKNVTQEELAQVLGVTRQTIIAIEKGNYSPSILLALKLGKFFKKKIEDIFQLKSKHD